MEAETINQFAPIIMWAAMAIGLLWRMRVETNNNKMLIDKIGTEFQGFRTEVNGKLDSINSSTTTLREEAIKSGKAVAVLQTNHRHLESLVTKIEGKLE